MAHSQWLEDAWMKKKMRKWYHERQREISRKNGSTRLSNAAASIIYTQADSFLWDLAILVIRAESSIPWLQGIKMWMEVEGLEAAADTIHTSLERKHQSMHRGRERTFRTERRAEAKAETQKHEPVQGGRYKRRLIIQWMSRKEVAVGSLIHHVRPHCQGKNVGFQSKWHERHGKPLSRRAKWSDLCLWRTNCK